MVKKSLWLEEAVTFIIIFIIALSLLSPCVSVESVVRGRVGGFAELGCSLTPSPDTPNLFPLHVVEWVRLGYNVPILIKFGGYTPRVHPKYKGRVSLSRGASLLVENLILEDEGWFECRILLLDRNAEHFQNGTWNFLSISAPPVLVRAPPAFLEVLLGDSLTLRCDAEGNPKPTITWRKESSDAVQVFNESLSLNKVTRDTAGTYKCHVSNSEGNLTHSTRLQVKGPPIITMSPEDTTMNMSQDAVLQCRAEAYPSNLTYEWWKHGQNVFHIESLRSRVRILVDGTLRISRLLPEDSGNYTCAPTNGLMTPPTASAALTVKHPARVVRMPRETYLPVGMKGKIVCPVQAEPPVLYVNWTKDGAALDLEQYPGWMVNSEGSVFITTANDDAVGMYTCTAYNSYGTMGQSEPTKVILKDPPSFRVSPRAEYLQEVGRNLMIPCQSQGDPAPNVTWLKVGAPSRSPFKVLSNGSLDLRPLSKDHQGAWQCVASNHVATVSVGTTVLVLGTSPHAVSAVSVNPGRNQANVSWDPGFDGGYTQKFTVWVKPTVRGKHEWASIPVPSTKSSLVVTGLQSATSYQFSVLAQNKLGSGPFSEIVTIRTLAPPTEGPSPATFTATFLPPILLSANRTSDGVLLQWVPPLEESPPFTAFVLQARRERGEWLTLDAEVPVNTTEMIVSGLVKDSNYEIRLLTRKNQQLSVPSEAVVVSTAGMEMYPAAPGLLAKVPEPLLAAVVGGTCFLMVAVTIFLVTACVLANRRERGQRKKRDDAHSALQTSTSPQGRSSSGSPDSVRKMKLCPPLNVFSHSFPPSRSSEYQDQKTQLLSTSSPPPRYALFDGHIGSSAFPSSPIESISRSPDGRFVIQPSPRTYAKETQKDISDSPTGRSESTSGSFKESNQTNPSRPQRESSAKWSSAMDTMRPSPSPGRVKEMARTFSRRGCFYSDDEQGSSSTLLEKASFYSDCTEKRTRDSFKNGRATCYSENMFQNLTGQVVDFKREKPPHLLRYKPIEALTTQGVPPLDGEKDVDNLGHCLTLVKEREQLEKELERYTQSRRAQAKELEQRRAKSASPSGKSIVDENEDPIWKPKEFQVQHKLQPSSADYQRRFFISSTSSPMERLHTSSPSAHIPWDLSPVTSPTSLVPVPSLCGGNSTAAEPLTEYTSLLFLSNISDVPSCPLTRSRSPSYLRPQSLTLNHATETRQQVTTVERGLGVCNLKTRDEDVRVAEDRSSPSYSASIGPQDVNGEGKVCVVAEEINNEQEKERLRSRSRKSDKCVFSENQSQISPLTLVESDVSNFSKTSEAVEVKLVPEPASVSLLQTSTILEYLSLPGFIEMSVDDPVDVNYPFESIVPSEEPPSRTFLRDEPDVVPKSWGQIHSQTVLDDPDLSGKRSVTDTENERLPSLGSQRQAFTPHNPAQTLINTTTNMAAKCPGVRVNKISSRICTGPVSLMKKSISIGPALTLSGDGPPRPFLKKSLSLGCQQRKRFENPRLYTPEASHTAGVKVKSYSLGRAPQHHYPTSVQDQRPFHLPACYSLERNQHFGRSYAHPAYHTPHFALPDPPRASHSRQSLHRHESDPRRLATVFSDSARWPVSYQETLRSAQRRYVPQDHPAALHPHRLASREVFTHPAEPGPPLLRPFLPRGYSWPSPYHTPLPRREQEARRTSAGGRCPSDTDGGRASYASQSSGRGSVGVLRQSLSITPTLLSSPETTEESESHRVLSDSRDKRSRRRNTSVDESYEWDALEGSGEVHVLEALKMERHAWRSRHDRPSSTPGLQELASVCPVSPPYVSQRHSLSDARFNALRQEFQQYRRTRGPSPRPHPAPEPHPSSARL